MNNQYTPGPWVAEKHADVLWIWTNDKKRIICFKPVDENSNPDNEANARLIAAAPDLLEALKDVVAIADRNTDVFNRAKAAIAKATCEKEVAP